MRIPHRWSTLALALLVALWMGSAPMALSAAGSSADAIAFQDDGGGRGGGGRGGGGRGGGGHGGGGHGGGGHGGGDRDSHAAPEIDPGLLVAGMVLLVGGSAILVGRRRLKHAAETS